MIYSTYLLRHLRLTIGQNIHAERTRKNWPLHKLSQLSGVSAFMLDHYELGKHNITIQDLFRIACALDVKAAELMQ